MISIHLCRKEVELRIALEKSVIKVTYTDDEGDIVAVSDDEDLYAAYEWASSHNVNIKF